jgi:hypothetical protein
MNNKIKWNVKDKMKMAQVRVPSITTTTTIS